METVSWYNRRFQNFLVTYCRSPGHTGRAFAACADREGPWGGSYLPESRSLCEAGGEARGTQVASGSALQGRDLSRIPQPMALPVFSPYLCWGVALAISLPHGSTAVHTQLNRHCPL